MCILQLNNLFALNIKMGLTKSRMTQKAALCKQENCHLPVINQGRDLKKNLARHSRIYTGVRPHVSNKCGRGFIEKHNLSNHMRVHKGDWRFVCEEYGNQFMYKQNLVKHIILHMVEKPFFCNECGEIFTQKQHLTKHSRIHTKEQPFLCNEWEKRYSQQVESWGPQTYAFKRAGHLMFFMIVETYLHSHRGEAIVKRILLRNNIWWETNAHTHWQISSGLLDEICSQSHCPVHSKKQYRSFVCDQRG